MEPGYGGWEARQRHARAFSDGQQRLHRAERPTRERTANGGVVLRVDPVVDAE